jgi:hypothetical protein
VEGERDTARATQSALGDMQDCRIPEPAMAEVLVQIDEPLRAADGRMFVAQVHGARGNSGLWEAWIEFVPRDGGEPVSTGPQTEQLTRGDLRYWAAGLTRGDLARALATALSPAAVAVPRGLVLPDIVISLGNEAMLETAMPHASSTPILDPIALYRQAGEYTLRHQLRALDAQQLRAIIAAYDIPEMDVVDLARTFEDALAERIVAGVQQLAAQPLRATA